MMKKKKKEKKKKKRKRKKIKKLSLIRSKDVQNGNYTNQPSLNLVLKML